MVMRIANINTPSPASNPILNVVSESIKPRYRSRFLINKGNAYVVLPVEEVAYFYVNEEIIYAVGFDMTENHIDSNMKTLEEELNPNIFFRVNRQFIVNIHSINCFENYFNGKLIVKTTPQSKAQMVVSRIKAKDFKEWIDC